MFPKTIKKYAGSSKRGVIISDWLIQQVFIESCYIPDSGDTESQRQGPHTQESYKLMGEANTV